MRTLKAILLTATLFALPSSSAAMPQDCPAAGIEWQGGEAGSVGTTLQLDWLNCGVSVALQTDPGYTLRGHMLVVGDSLLSTPFPLRAPFHPSSLLEVRPDRLWGPFAFQRSNHRLPNDPSLLNVTFYVQGIAFLAQNQLPAPLGISRPAELVFLPE